MDFEITTPNGSNLPNIDQLWKKIRIDLAKGFRVNATQGHQVVRVYTVNKNINWKFLIISSANKTMPPVFSVELNAYTNTKESWRLNLKYTPIPTPKWTHTWEKLIDMYVADEEITNNMQSSVISAYLGSVLDESSTKSAFERINYHPHTANWVNQE